jgi:hypothetical protein
MPLFWLMIEPEEVDRVPGAICQRRSSARPAVCE